MTRLIFSPAAQEDIEQIYEYSYETWGLEQAESYILGLSKMCAQLTSGEKRGRDASDIRDRYRIVFEASKRAERICAYKFNRRLGGNALAIKQSILIQSGFEG